MKIIKNRTGKTKGEESVMARISKTGEKPRSVSFTHTSTAEINKLIRQNLGFLEDKVNASDMIYHLTTMKSMKLWEINNYINFLIEELKKPFGDRRL